MGLYDQLTPYTRFLELKAAIAQILSSRISVGSIALFLLSFSVYIGNLFTFDNSLIDYIFLYLLFIFGSATYFLVTIAITTGIHEGGHLRVVKGLGLTVVLHVNRIGDVWIKYPPVTKERLSEEDHYSIGIGPYTRWIDFISLPVLSLGWIGITVVAPRYFDIVLWVVFILFVIKIIADIFAFLTVRYQLIGGIIPKIAWFFTSRGDIAGITRYHRKLKQDE